MEPLAIAIGLATALCVVFLIYGAWLCLGEQVLLEPRQAAQADSSADSETSIGSVAQQ